MASGIEIKNAAGVVQFDAGTRLLRALVPDFTGASAGGTVTVAPNQGKVVAAIGAEESGTGNAGNVTVADNVVTWANGKIVYGSILVY